jgi:hypothetical protein
MPNVERQVRFGHSAVNVQKTAAEGDSLARVIIAQMFWYDNSSGIWCSDGNADNFPIVPVEN